MPTSRCTGGPRPTRQKKDWRRLRRGVADLHRRAEVSRAGNDRYLAALASAASPRTVGEAVGPACRPVTRGGRRHRGLRPGHAADMGLLRAVADGRWAVNGFRNADVRANCSGADEKDAKAARRRAGQVTRRLALLRAHGLVKRVPKTRRWLLTDKGRDVATLSRTKDADAKGRGRDRRQNLRARTRNERLVIQRPTRLPAPWF